MKLTHLLFLLVTAMFVNDANGVKLGEGPGQTRPEQVQDQVNGAFGTLAKSASPYWTKNGDRGLYGLGWFPEDVYIKDLVLTTEGPKTFSLLDYGAGNFAWNRAVRAVLEQEDVALHMAKYNIHVNIVGLRGEPYHQVERPSAFLADYRFGCVKIENLGEELQRLGLGDLRFDFIAANWTLRHLVDPLGSFKECMDTLKEGGLFAFQGFYAQLDGAMEKAQILDVPEILQRTGCPWAVADCSNGGDRGQFLVLKSQIPSFPYAYTNSCLFRGFNNVASGIVQGYRRLLPKLCFSGSESVRETPNWVTLNTNNQELSKLWKKYQDLANISKEQYPDGFGFADPRQIFPVELP